MDDFLQEAPRKVSPVFCCVPITIKEDALYFSAEVPQRAEGERPEPWMNAAMGSRVPA